MSILCLGRRNFKSRVVTRAGRHQRGSLYINHIHSTRHFQSISQQRGSLPRKTPIMSETKKPKYSQRRLGPSRNTGSPPETGSNSELMGLSRTALSRSPSYTDRANMDRFSEFMVPFRVPNKPTSMNAIPDASFNNTVVFLPPLFQSLGSTVRSGGSAKGTLLVRDKDRAYKVYDVSHIRSGTAMETLSVINRPGTHEVGGQLAGGARQDSTELPGLTRWDGATFTRGSRQVKAGASWRLSEAPSSLVAPKRRQWLDTGRPAPTADQQEPPVGKQKKNRESHSSDSALDSDEARDLMELLVDATNAPSPTPTTNDRGDRCTRHP